MEGVVEEDEEAVLEARVARLELDSTRKLGWRREL